MSQYKILHQQNKTYIPLLLKHPTLTYHKLNQTTFNPFTATLTVFSFVFEFHFRSLKHAADYAALIHPTIFCKKANLFIFSFFYHIRVPLFLTW